MFDIANTPLDDFQHRAEEIIEEFYLPPYPKKPIPYQWQACPAKKNLKNGILERVFHGGMHVGRATGYVDHCDYLYAKYDQNYIYDLNSLSRSLDTNTDSVLKLVKYAVLFHDSARQDEEEDFWDSPSAENCRRYLIKHGVPEHLAEVFSAAARLKGNPQLYFQAITDINQKYKLNIGFRAAEYLRSFISSVDCLDIIRVREEFDLKYLDIFQKLIKLPAARKEVYEMCQNAADLIAHQHDAYFPCKMYINGNYHSTLIAKENFSVKKKLAYEHAEHPFLAVTQELKNFGFVVKAYAAKLSPKLK